MTRPGVGAAVRRCGTRLIGCALAAALLTGCAQSVDPLERMGRKAAQKVRSHPHRAAARAPGAAGPGRDDRAGPAAHRRWGLAEPLDPPPAPPSRPVLPRRAPGAVPPVIERVPTRDKVVFLTFDGGVERDPRFPQLVRDLRLPVSVFLDGSAAGPGRGPYGTLRALGAGVQNRTLTHPYLPGLGYVRQHAEICGQQRRLAGRFGRAPRLLRPPSGDYDASTLRAAGACGIDAIVLGRDPSRTDRLRPGDIILPPRGTGPLTTPTTRLLHHIQQQGFTVARLEDYV
ncbi:polysaccharide deacetylase family protein [Streptomyces xanthii]|nr:polysaccharide deacetylase family protein [Streptomyces xanthii]